MGRKTQRAPLMLDQDQYNQLTKIANSHKNPVREVQRANILLKYHAGQTITNIHKNLSVSKKMIYKCIDKALAMGPAAGLADKYHSPKSPVITDNAKAWVVNLACSKPKDHGYAAELWTLSKLAAHTRQHAPKAGYDCLKKAVKATIHRVLKNQPLKPHKTRYYLERKDPEFEEKMKEVLIVYQEVNLQKQVVDKDSKKPIITVSVDEKPGIQAIRNVAPDLPPKAGKYPAWSRDYEYKRLGTLSLLASLDLHDGHVIAQVHDRHRSREFICLLKELDAYYPKDCAIRLILDNHSAHISKETMAYLASRTNRFIYIHTPKHGSWLNLVETLFSKISRTFLKKIRVESIQELRERILKGIAEINESPVVHRWRKFDLATT